MPVSQHLGRHTPLPPPTPAPSIAAVAARKMLALQMQAQTQTNWCWAAVTASICRFFKPTTAWTQCNIAATCLNGLPCCTSPDPCNSPQPLTPALKSTGRLAAHGAGNIAYAAVINEINAGRPVACHITWPDGNGHFITVIGYNQGTGYVDIRDPDPTAPPSITMPYTAFTSNYGAGRWDWTYRTK